MDFQLWSRSFQKTFALCFLLLNGTLTSLRAEKHSLYYIYTGLSKPVDVPGIYRFTAMGLLDDRQIDYYNSQDQRKIPKQDWMKEKLEEDYWKKGTQWIKDNLNILMQCMRQNESDLHVLQWRHGCEIQLQGDAIKFSKDVDEYVYDGEHFLSYDIKESRWVASGKPAQQTKRKWDDLPILNQYTKGYMEQECVDWLNKFRGYADEALRNSSLPDVHVFARTSTKEKAKLKLTCVATGFFHKDVMVTIRKYRTPIPDNETQSTVVQPNQDGSYQKRISVEIQKNETADYDCYMAHRTLKEPIIIKWDGKCQDCPSETELGLIWVVVAVVLMLAVVVLLVYYLKPKIIADNRQPDADQRPVASTSAVETPVTDERRLASTLPLTSHSHPKKPEELRDRLFILTKEELHLLQSQTW